MQADLSSSTSDNAGIKSQTLHPTRILSRQAVVRELTPQQTGQPRGAEQGPQIAVALEDTEQHDGQERARLSHNTTPSSQPLSTTPDGGLSCSAGDNQQEPKP